MRRDKPPAVPVRFAMVRYNQPDVRMTRRRHCLTAILLVASFGFGACGGNGSGTPPATLSGDGQSRSYAMGISSLPPKLTEDSYAQTFQLAASAGEVILIQHTVPWKDMLAGDLSENTVQTTQRETALARENGLDLFVAIDPTDAAAGRSQLAGLPEDLAGAGFANEEVRRAFTAYAQYVAENYRPKYLALGVEINSYQRYHPEDFERFVILYHETYEAVKALSPDTLVFPTFQLEELKGLLPLDDPYPTQWHLISRFMPRLDLLAVSSFPSVVYDDPAEIPAVYYTQLTAYTDRPVAISGLGYSSAPASDGEDAAAEDRQTAFLRRVLDSAEQVAMPLVVWFLGQDPTFTAEPPLDKLQYIGLVRQDGTNKPAWNVWSLAARRPIEGGEQ